MSGQQLSFGVLGPLEVRCEGRPVALPSARQRAVLAALLVRAGRPVPADSLIDAAWGGAPPEAPRAALHTVVSRLRSTLGAETIRREHGGYRLDPAGDALDAARFESLRAEATRTPAEPALQRLTAATQLWRGPAYAEFADRDFARPEAVRLEELRLATIEERAALHLETGDAVAATAVLEPFVVEHPLRERARELLMTALYRAGRLGEALDHYTGYRTALAEELGLDPSPAVRDLHRRLLDHDLPPSGPALPGTPAAAAWPPPDDAFLGRADEAEQLVDLVQRHRAVTLTGPGGVGKSRLLAESLPAASGRVRLPATVVELAGVPPDQVERAVAARLGLGPVRGDVREAVLEYLAVTPMLLVLDGCESVLPSLRSFVGAVLRRCTRVRVLATSRQRIGLAAEQLLPLRPLAAPSPDAPPADARLTASLELFTDRARRVRPDFALTDAAVPAVGEICRRLDGLPLAIELAATRAAVLGVGPVHERLDESLDLLDGDAGPSGRSLRAALSVSYDLLPPSERTLFGALAVFPDEFDMAAAEEMARRCGVGSVAGVLAGLVDASLVVAPGDARSARFRQLEIVRLFALERLAETGDEDAARLAHAHWVRTTLWAAARAAEGPDGTVAAADVGARAASIRSAALWASRTGRAELAAEIAGGLVLAAEHRQIPLDLADVVRQVAEDPAVGASAAASLARGAGAFVAVAQGDLDAAERAAGEALPGARSSDERFLALATRGIVALYRGDLVGAGHRIQQVLAIEGLPIARQVDAQASLALVACYRGDLPRADRHAMWATTAAEAAGADAYSVFARYAAGEVAAARDPASAVPLLAAVAEDADRVGADFAAGLAATALAAALTRLGRPAEALEVLGPLLDRWLRLARWPQLWTSLRILADVLVAHDRPETAALLLAAADQAPSAPSVTGHEAVRHDTVIRALRQRTGEPVYERIAALAAVLPRAEVVDRARASIRDLRPAST